jgi:hypothetical protein
MIRKTLMFQLNNKPADFNENKKIKLKFSEQNYINSFKIVTL